MDIALILDFAHQLGAVLIIDEYVLLLHSELSLGLLQEIENGTILKMDKNVSE